MSRTTARRTRPSAIAFVAAGALLAAGGATAFSRPAADGRPSADAACPTPAKAIGLSSNWKLQLPVESPDKPGSPQEVKQPALASFAKAPWFTTTSGCDAALFRSAVNGTTTNNTGYPRSELREMSNSGKDNASWGSGSGTHTMVVDEAITHLPKEKPQVIAGQIHDETSDVTSFRLDGSSLYATSYNDTHYKLVTDNYKLGTRFEGKFVVSDGAVKVYYNGALKATVKADYGSGYFKAGAYTQANCDNSSPCSNDNYGEVALYGVSVTHS